ncbi:MAG: hypothetical protein IPP73_07585 [Chitinophagaceae bacterium]|nr:hypothetical protein [Chitinophagaceae bacterium]
MRSIIILLFCISFSSAYCQPEEKLNSDLINHIKNNKDCSNNERALSLLRAIEIKITVSPELSASFIQSILYAEDISECQLIKNEAAVAYNLLAFNDNCIDKIVDLFLSNDDIKIRKRSFEIFLSLYISQDCKSLNTYILTKNRRNEKIYNWLLRGNQIDFLNNNLLRQCNFTPTFEIQMSTKSPISLLFFNYELPHIERVKIMEICMKSYNYRINPPFFYR